MNEMLNETKLVLTGASRSNLCGINYFGRFACVGSYRRYSLRSYKDRFIGHFT